MNDNYKEKLDHGLRMELEKNGAVESSEKIQFLGKCNEEISEETKTMIEQTGVKVGTVTKDIFTASGTLDQIVDLAKLDFIKYLEKSKELYPHN
ncbi:MAG: hypothetical protein U5K00_19105 [Melioribacteraceae bacterium]|nr:hypothetical protein [Melioribacteraceae bacterium]